MHLLLEFGEHFLVVLALFGEFRSVPLAHVLHDLLELLHLQNSLVSLQQHVLHLLLALVHDLPHVLFPPSQGGDPGLVGIAHFDSLLKIRFQFLILSLEPPQSLFGTLEFLLEDHHFIEGFFLPLYGIVELALHGIDFDGLPFQIFSPDLLMVEHLAA